MNLRLGKISRIVSPGYSWCQRCGTTWNFVNPHIVDYEAHHGSFALCEKCWDESGVDDRIQYHFDSLMRLGSYDEVKWAKIQSTIETSTVSM